MAPEQDKALPSDDNNLGRIVLRNSPVANYLLRIEGQVGKT